MYEIHFNTEIKAYLEMNLDHANELFAIAKQHRLTYMALNERAFALHKPVIDWFLERDLFDICIDYMHENIPDCIERTLSVKTVLDKQKKFFEGKQK